MVAQDAALRIRVWTIERAGSLDLGKRSMLRRGFAAEVLAAALRDL